MRNYSIIKPKKSAPWSKFLLAIIAIGVVIGIFAFLRSNFFHDNPDTIDNTVRPSITEYYAPVIIRTDTVNNVCDLSIALSTTELKTVLSDMETWCVSKAIVSAFSLPNGSVYQFKTNKQDAVAALSFMDEYLATHPELTDNPPEIERILSNPDNPSAVVIPNANLYVRYNVRVDCDFSSTETGNYVDWYAAMHNYDIGAIYQYCVNNDLLDFTLKDIVIDGYTCSVKIPNYALKAAREQIEAKNAPSTITLPVEVTQLSRTNTNSETSPEGVVPKTAAAESTETPETASVPETTEETVEETTAISTGPNETETGYTPAVSPDSTETEASTNASDPETPENTNKFMAWVKQHPMGVGLFFGICFSIIVGGLIAFLKKNNDSYDYPTDRPTRRNNNHYDEEYGEDEDYYRTDWRDMNREDPEHESRTNSETSWETWTGSDEDEIEDNENSEN